MKICYFTRISRVLFFISLINIGCVFGMSDDTQAKFDTALRNWRTISATTLADPSNADLLHELRKYALKTHSEQATMPLLNEGDPDVTHDYLSRYHNANPTDRGSLASLLKLSNNADIITLIGDDLNRNEPSKFLHFGEDLVAYPLSVESAIVIKKIILNSPLFSPQVEAWARELPGVGESIRQPMKAWWNQNKVLLKAKQYGDVKPPR